MDALKSNVRDERHPSKGEQLRRDGLAVLSVCTGAPKFDDLMEDIVQNNSEKAPSEDDYG